MGLFDKAKEAADHAAERARNAAEQAAERASGAAGRAQEQVRSGSGGAGDQLRAAAGQARVAAGQLGKATGDAANKAATAVADPVNQARARDAAQHGLKRAKSGVASMIDRIDPGLLADIVIKATSLQEKSNRSLREKHSPYRINEITITAGLPPDVAFTIGRIEVEEEDFEPTTDAAANEPELAADEAAGGADDVDGEDLTGLGPGEVLGTFDDPSAPSGVAGEAGALDVTEPRVGLPVMAPAATPAPGPESAPVVSRRSAARS